jgi:hypothetical protein
MQEDSAIASHTARFLSKSSANLHWKIVYIVIIHNRYALILCTSQKECIKLKSYQYFLSYGSYNLDKT